MNQQIVTWKPISISTPTGKRVESEFLCVIDQFYRRRLLQEICAMPPGTQISLDRAVRMVVFRFFNSVPGRDKMQSNWFLSHFVEWVSSLGYQIVLTGDEFSAPVDSENTH